MHTDRATSKSVEHDTQQIMEGTARAFLKVLELLQSNLQRKNKLSVNVAPAETQKLGIAIEPDTPSSRLTSSIATAHTATHLLNQHGRQLGQETVYKAQDYTIRASQADTTIENRQGELLMRFKPGQEPQIQEAHMGDREFQDFARVQQQIQRHGIAQLPEDRLRQYQNLAPVQDSDQAKSARDLAAIISAQRVLSATGNNAYESDHYQFSQQGESLTIRAKDERGEIAQLQDGRVAGNLSARDTAEIQQLERGVARPETQSQAENLNLTPLEAVVYDRLLSTSSFSSADAKVLAEQAVKPSLAADPDLRTMVFSKEEAIARSGQDANQAQSVQNRQLEHSNTGKDQEREI